MLFLCLHRTRSMDTASKRLFLILSLLVFLPQVSFAAGCSPNAGAGFSCSSPGSYTYNVGAYRTVTVTVNGAGGGGGGGTSGTNNWTSGGAGGGGGAGAIRSGTYDVYPGGNMYIYIGAGGARGQAGDEINRPVGVPGFPGIPSSVSGFLTAPEFIMAGGGGRWGRGSSSRLFWRFTAVSGNLREWIHPYHSLSSFYW